MENVSPRNYFAGQAMHVIMTIFPSQQPANVAEVAFRFADAMVKASALPPVAARTLSKEETRINNLL